MILYHDVMELYKRGVTVEAADEEEKDVHKVEKIVDHAVSIKDGTRRYKVRWAGWAEAFDSWLYEKDLEHCAEVVQAYELAQVGVTTVSCLGQFGKIPEGEEEGLLIAQVTSWALAPSHFSGAIDFWCRVRR